ncbi:MAG: cob(I)yrinic acid a,c-diamide adenosyltransferase [Acidimicrobiales bacterium]
MKIYTRRGDDGTTALRAGGRVGKDSTRIEALGTIDEAQAALGVARARCVEHAGIAMVLLEVERDLWVVMAEVATDPGQLRRFEPGVTEVTAAMVEHLEGLIDAHSSATEAISDFTVPGEDAGSAALEVARTVVRRAERRLVPVELKEASSAPAYLNRLSDLCWTLARAVEHDPRFANDEGEGK